MCIRRMEWAGVDTGESDAVMLILLKTWHKGKSDMLTI